MEISQVRIYRDVAQFKAVVYKQTGQSVLVIPENCIPDSILILADNEIVDFVAKYNSGSNVEVEFHTSKLKLVVSWLTPNFNWKPLYKIVEVAPGQFPNKMEYCITNSSNSPLRFSELILHNTRLMKEGHHSYEMSAPRAAMAQMQPSDSSSATTTIGEGRTFTVPLLDRLNVGTTIVAGPSDDFKVEGITFVFDVSQEGEQHPTMQLIVASNATEETPSGSLAVHQSTSMLVGSGRMPDMAPGQRTYIEVAKSRKLKATIVITKKAVEKSPVQQEGVIIKKVGITITIENHTNDVFRVTLAHPTDNSISEFIGPKPTVNSLGWSWILPDVGKDGGMAKISYYQQFDRR